MNPLRNLFLHISRMPPAVMLVLIIGLGAIVTFIVNDQVNRAKDKYDVETKRLTDAMNKPVKVVYAIKDIPEGQTIPSEALEERTVTGSAPLDALSSASLASGRVAKYGISANNIVSQHDLAPHLTEIGFSARLKEGMRAIAFAVDNNTGVAGFIQPDSRVDVISMVGAGSDTKAAPVLSDVEVIAVGQMYQKAPGGGAQPASSITVAVTPEDTQKLIKAICASKLYLALRNDKDHTPLATVDVTSLFGKPASSQHNKDLLSLAAPSMLQPPPLEVTDPIGQAGNKGMVAPPPANLHEIEMWSASKKDMVTLTN